LSGIRGNTEEQNEIDNESSAEKAEHESDIVTCSSTTDLCFLPLATALLQRRHAEIPWIAFHACPEKGRESTGSRAVPSFCFSFQAAAGVLLLRSYRSDEIDKIDP
jgi:hypothetical protein